MYDWFEDGVDVIPFTQGVLDGDRLIDKGADPIADLAAYALQRNAAITVYDRDPHTHVFPLGYRGQGA